MEGALMRDMSKEKDASRVKAMQLYPYTAKDLARKKDHARGDALLLAHYGMLFGTPQEAPKRADPNQTTARVSIHVTGSATGKGNLTGIMPLELFRLEPASSS